MGGDIGSLSAAAKPAAPAPAPAAPRTAPSFQLGDMVGAAPAAAAAVAPPPAARPAPSFQLGEMVGDVTPTSAPPAPAAAPPSASGFQLGGLIGEELPSAPPTPPPAPSSFQLGAELAPAAPVPPPAPPPQPPPPPQAQTQPHPQAQSMPPPAGGGGGPPPGGGGGGGGPPPGGGGGAPPGGGMARIGDKLVDMGLISKDQLHVALFEKKRTNKMIGQTLIDLGFITEQALSAVLAQSSGFERFDPKSTVVDPDLIKKFPKEVAARYRVFPVAIDGQQARLAMADIYDVLALDQARRYFPPGVEISPLVCGETEINEAIDQYFGYELSIDGILRELETGKHDTSTAAISSDAGYVHPLVRLVNALVLDAVKVGASDIHFEPEGMFLRLRYRIDGVMTQVRTIHKDHWPAVSHRLKIVSGMNIADKLNPQDGRFSITLGNRKVDFRVAAMPTSHGENIVLRILDKSKSLLGIPQLGLSENNETLLLKLLKRPEGIIIVTGPTGSGKTTTLYGILAHINSLDVNIMTLEDPVEYELPLIRQAQVREGTGMNFADGVRALLRQDPDIIFIGEVRDKDTATMALRASMTGHQVFTTLHTNDAAGALPRLGDLGLDATLMAGNIIGILAQRLSRRLCQVCREIKPASVEECRILGADPDNPPKIGHAKGCEACRHTGYKGRLALHEILPMNKELDEMVIEGASMNMIRQAAHKYGFIPMADDGIGKVLKGLISVEELIGTVDVTDRL
jgi:general secretion pathway protein E/type IV pilus assembly protein PilB